jgi:hypothetical protein
MIFNASDGRMFEVMAPKTAPINDVGTRNFIAL